MNKQTITINGQTYDKHTGMPVVGEPTQHKSAHKQSATAHSSSLHHRQQKSTTLNRRYVKKSPQAAAAPPSSSTVRAQASPAIRKFAIPEEKPAATKPASAKHLDISPVKHPAHERAKAVQHHKAAPTAHKPSHILKKEAEHKALSEATAHKQTEHKAPRKPKSRHARRLSMAAAGAGLLLLGGYFTYMSMPSVSTRVAAAQAGIEATYPSYKPSGYSLSGPVAYHNGQVHMSFAMNSGDGSYDLDQERSVWDSTAVLQNYVEPAVGQNYMITNIGGLTIYTYETNAAWVSGGILYTISGDAPLSSEQIQKIATSM